MSFPRKAVLVGIVLAGAAGCRVEVAAPIPHRVVVVDEPGGACVVEEHRGALVVDLEPPFPRHEVILWELRPSPSHAWIRGHWAWDGVAWVWIPGRWAPCPLGVGYTWRPGYWELRSGRWFWVSGVWIRI